MRAIREVTQWGPEFPGINHVYLVDGDSAYAYIKYGSLEMPQYFSKPLRLDMRRRQFIEVKPSPFDEAVDPAEVRVTGSRGDEYIVNTREKSCSCPGFRYHGKCKHIDKLGEKK